MCKTEPESFSGLSSATMFETCWQCRSTQRLLVFSVRFCRRRFNKNRKRSYLQKVATTLACMRLVHSYIFPCRIIACRRNHIGMYTVGSFVDFSLVVSLHVLLRLCPHQHCCCMTTCVKPLPRTMRHGVCKPSWFFVLSLACWALWPWASDGCSPVWVLILN